VLLIDDHAMLLDGLEALLTPESDMVVAGRAQTREEAVRVAQHCNPDVALVDLLIPGGGLNTIASLRTTCPDVKVLVLTILDDVEHVVAAQERGGSGYLIKRSAASELLSAIRALSRGETYFPSIAQQSASLEISGPPPNAADLSTRETQVLRLLALGMTHKEIGERLQVSKKSIDTYRVRLQQKLGLQGRAALVRYAIATGQFGDPLDV
jgi:DNA-binding NarL/FixJ family response regulator